ncbi:MAG: DNA (cytosine-5-)-methyltransferase [Bacilli bacterium]|nr:DNA (cytosine-5-)-methyltransferase [Bacilli bacterium]
MAGQMTLFNLMDDTPDLYKIHNKVRLIELFAGIGSQAMALKRLGVDFEHYRCVEYNKYPVMSYNAIHGTDFKPTDITKLSGEDLGIVDTDKYTYIMTYSFPCQDLSLAGKQKGMSKGSGTRSGLLWEVERLLNECKELPQILLMENVIQVHDDKNIDDFENWREYLTNKGYTNFLQDLNAKNYGVAQSRTRAYMVSILGNANYVFPEPINLNYVMEDYLQDESEIEEKYYLKSKKVTNFLQKLKDDNKLNNV